MVVVAAGRSLRLGAALPKPFLRAGGQPLLAWSLLAFARAPSVGAIVVVAPTHQLRRARGIVRGKRKIVAVVPGGARRQDSVAAGVAALPPGFDPVLVHDAARPLVAPELIEAVVAGARRHGAAIAASPVPDTLKEVSGQRVLRTVDRSHLWRAETPQGARRAWLVAALADREDATDEAMMLERSGYPVAIVASDGLNLKVTTPGDLRIVRAVLGFGRPR